MTTNITFNFGKDSDSNLRVLSAVHGATPIAVESNKLTTTVSNIFDTLISKNPLKYQVAIQSLDFFSVTFIHPNSGQNSLKIESDDVVIHLNKISEQTAASFLNVIHTPQKSTVEWIVEALTYMVSRLVEALTYVFSPGRHFTKWTKYRLIQEQLEQFTRSKNIEKLTNSPTDLEIRTTWNSLIEALLEPTHFETPDKQYRKMLECLCKMQQLLGIQTAQEKFPDQLKFVRELAHKLFTGIELYPYCRQLIEIASGKPLPPILTIDTFLAEFKDRAIIVKNPLGSTAMNPIACKKHMLKGTINWNFAPLLKTSNIPYRDGQITVNDRSTLMLWHGTPVEQHDPYGLMFDLAAGALSHIPYVGDWIGDTNPFTSPPVINDHYIAFIEGAEEKNETILHVILENGQKKRFGDESGRVKARLKLNEHKNFFPIALNLDGTFFERHDEFKGQTESMESLKKRLKTQLLSPLSGADEVAQMEDQLAKTGFCIPQKLRVASKLEDNIDSLLNEVQQIYFSDKQDIKTQEEHQAFLILSYVHILLFICWKMDIKILEALCKDDKDRGNVIKTILKLHFLYITGQINHENLTSVLTHVLARPFILQKAPIVKSRLILLERVIPFINDAHEKIRLPETAVFGKPIKAASYTVDKPLKQTIYPNNATSRTLEEYRVFLENHRPIQIPLHRDNLIQKLAQKFYPKGNRKDAAIQQKISAAAKMMDISIGELLLKPEPLASAHTSIVSFLHKQFSLSEEAAWRVSCSFHEGLGQMLHTRLNGIFANPSLGISVKLESGLSLPSIRLTKEGGLRFDAFFSINDGAVSYGGIKASMTIMDLTKGHAQFEYSLSGV